jgi:hypothetical protein
MSGFTHEPPGGGKPDWYTPKWIFDGLGCEFNLDPCHPAKRLPWVPVSRTISLPWDGLAATWEGRVWLNPPYGKETPLWLKKMSEHGDGIALVFSRTDTQWFHDAITNTSGILFLKDRVRFIDSATMEPGGSPGCGSVLISWGGPCAEILRTAKLKGTYFPLNANVPSWLM